MNQHEWQKCQCGASWLGHWYEACDWCWLRQQRDLEHYRQSLLHPAHLMPQTSLRYEELSELDQAVWRDTRGIRREYQPEREWLVQLGQAVANELITSAEMMAAFKRVFISGPSRSTENP